MRTEGATILTAIFSSMNPGEKMEDHAITLLVLSLPHRTPFDCGFTWAAAPSLMTCSHPMKYCSLTLSSTAEIGDLANFSLAGV
jgi:hypothetical protein